MTDRDLGAEVDQATRFKRVVENNVNHLAVRVHEDRTGILLDDGMKEGAAILAGWSPKQASEEPACFIDGVRGVLVQMGLGSRFGVEVEWKDWRDPRTNKFGKVWLPYLVRASSRTNGLESQ